MNFVLPSSEKLILGGLVPKGSVSTLTTYLLLPVVRTLSVAAKFSKALFKEFLIALLVVCSGSIAGL